MRELQSRLIDITFVKSMNKKNYFEKRKKVLYCTFKNQYHPLEDLDIKEYLFESGESKLPNNFYS